MSPLYMDMDTGYDDNSLGSLSAEDCNSNTAGSEREGEGGQQVTGTGRKRREKNRDAARKTRRKQTERADQLHEELQALERTNSALQKEITGLKKELQHYTTALAHHEPYCLQRASVSSSGSVPAPTSAKSRTSSSPPKVAPRTSSSALAAAPSVSTSFASGLGLQTLDSVENPHLSSSTLPSSCGSPAELVSPASSSSSSSPVTVPYSVSFSALPAPHSLFSKEPPTASLLTNVTPVCTSHVSTCNFSNALTTAGPTRQNTHTHTHKASSVPANARFSALRSDTLEFLTASCVAPPYSHVNGGNENLLAQGYPLNVPQLHPGQYNGIPNNLNVLSPSTPPDPAFQSFTVPPQVNLQPAPPPFALKPNFRQVAPNPAPMLSLLTVPSPLNITYTTSNSTDRLSCQPAPSQPPSADSTNDLSLSELLEVNDWILSGAGDL